MRISLFVYAFVYGVNLVVNTEMVKFVKLIRQSDISILICLIILIINTKKDRYAKWSFLHSETNDLPGVK